MTSEDRKKTKASKHRDVEDRTSRLPKKAYEKELRRLQEELVKLEDWVAAVGARIVVIFEGRDAAGKGGTIKRITQFMNPRITRIVIGKRQYAGYIQDVSEGGARLRTVTSIRKLGNVILRLPDLPPLTCRLCWTDAYHAGVVFERKLTKADLRKWVETRAAFIELNNGPEAECELIGVLDDIMLAEEG